MTIIAVVIQTTTIIHLITIVVQVILTMIVVATIRATTTVVLMIAVAVGQVVVIRQVMIQEVLMIVHLQVRLIGSGRPKMAYNGRVFAFVRLREYSRLAQMLMPHDANTMLAAVASTALDTKHKKNELKILKRWI